MRIAADISPDDHRDFIRSRPNGGTEEAEAHESARDLSNVRIRLCLMMAAFFGVLIWIVYRRGLDGLLDRPLVLTLTVIGLLAVPVAVLWLMSLRPLHKDLKEIARGNFVDQSALREGLNVGEAYFDLDQGGLTISLALVRESYPWSAFRELKETSTAFHLMVDVGSGLILPKRAFGDELKRQEFEAFVAEHIGAGG